MNTLLRIGVGGALCLGMSAIADPPGPESSPTFIITWQTIDGGGITTATGGGFELTGTVGQPDAFTSAEGGFSLVGGFWGIDIPHCVVDYNYDGFGNGDDFDEFVDDFQAGSPATDFNGDGFVTGDDFDLFVDAFIAGCE